MTGLFTCGSAVCSICMLWYSISGIKWMCHLPVYPQVRHFNWIRIIWLLLVDIQKCWHSSLVYMTEQDCVKVIAVNMIDSWVGWLYGMSTLIRLSNARVSLFSSNCFQKVSRKPYPMETNYYWYRLCRWLCTSSKYTCLRWVYAV